MKFLATISLLFLSVMARAQFITITGTVQDSNGHPYANGTGRVVLTPQFVNWLIGNSPVQTPLTISGLDSFGKFSISLPSTAVISPASSNPQWQFSFTNQSCPNQPIPASFTMTPLTLTTSQDISTTIQAQAAPSLCSGGSSPTVPGSPTGSIQGNNAGAFGGVPGSSIDFTNGLVSLAPTGTGVALSLTGDNAFSAIATVTAHGDTLPGISFFAQTLGSNNWKTNIANSQITEFALGGIVNQFSVNAGNIMGVAAGSTAIALSVLSDSSTDDIQRWENNTGSTVLAKINTTGGLQLLPGGNSSACNGKFALADGTGCSNIPTQYAKLRCETGLGDGLNAMAAGTYLQSFCFNDSGVTWTITGIKCFTDNSGSSTLNASGHTLGALLTGAITCSPAFVSGTQSANVALTSGDYIAFTFVADGASKQTTWVVSMTQ